MGFEAPLKGEIQRLEDGEWKRVVETEQREGYVVRDRRRTDVKAAESEDAA
jgi:hypothetical protein